VVLLDLAGLVVDVQAGSDSVGDDPGPEPARGRPDAAALDAPVEDEADLVGPADVEVVAGNWIGAVVDLSVPWWCGVR
jgi:hypothetical protein